VHAVLTLQSEHARCAQAFKLAVGREYRLIDRFDVVPALPPFTGYIQLDFPLWIQVCALTSIVPLIVQLGKDSLKPMLLSACRQ